ncbi:high affinity sulfate transporter 1 [Conyzicola lurida]|uniref:High affinity sulfate transporter 1 n=1 Tax=Conyzicola lurida TaxID=1172621 RepID=A0A841ANZ6_9MICO|nr:SulP family inorganic anion transporter [Conyzicola lurida]MBB5843471.1 high affinity sulfate transporter 1 [Conyzicola lurida]
MRVLPGLTRGNLLRESASGVTLLAIAVPLNIGYAQIAGLPPTAGLYSLVLPMVAFALLASSRQLVVSPDAAAAALVASSLGGLAAAGSDDYLTMALAQALIGGVLFLVCAVLKLGFLANFLSEPILVGFVGGLALDILVSQIAKMLGVSIDSGAEFVTKIGQLVTGLGTTNPWSLALAVGSVVVLVAGRRLARQVPWALVVLVLATVVTVAASLEDDGVGVLGPVQAGAPVLTWPSLSWGQWGALVPSAVALTLVAMAEGLLVSRSYGQKRGYSTSPNRDLAAFGVANLASGLTGGFTIGSSTSRTAAVDQLGSRTQLPSIVAAVGTLLLLIFGTGLLADIPSPAIGAIVTIAILPLLGFRELAALWRVRPFEFWVGAVCFLGALLLGPITGIVLAFVLSLINLAMRASRPPVDLLSSSDLPNGSLLPLSPGEFLTAPGVVVVRFAAPLFFANASVFDDAIRKAVAGGQPLGLRHLVLDCEAMTDIDVTGAAAFRETAAWLREQRVTLHFSRVRPDFAAVLHDFGLGAGVEVFGTNRQALEALARRG